MNKMLFNRISLSFFFISMIFSLHAERPIWINNPPAPLNHTYKIVDIHSYGSTLSEARENAKVKLEDDRQLQEGIQVYRKQKKNTTIDKNRINNKLQKNKNEHIEIETVIDGQKYEIQAVRLDEYANYNHKECELYTLYMVAVCDNPIFDNAYVTNSYGAAPVFMSIIPGLGQWYKGSKVKGISIFAAEAVAVAGIIVCENQRASYIKRSKENPKFAREYGNKADSWNTGRNITIGVAAGLWLYNIIDAAVAKGARKVVVKPSNGGGLAISPYATFDGSIGMSLAYKF